jgi:hypothetical protein
MTVAKLIQLRRLVLGILAIIDAELRERGALREQTIIISDYQEQR